MTINELRELALHAVRGTAPAEFTVDNVNDAFADGLKEFAGTYNQFMKNRYDLYDIIIQNADEIVPAKVIDQLGAFAEVRQIGQGQKAMFRVGKDASKMRAKRFLTQVGLAGVYEAFRQGNMEKALEWQNRIVACSRGIKPVPQIPAIKAMLKMQGVIADDTCRRPFRKLTADEYRLLEAALNDYEKESVL